MYTIFNLAFLISFSSSAYNKNIAPHRIINKNINQIATSFNFSNKIHQFQVVEGKNILRILFIKLLLDDTHLKLSEYHIS